MVFGKRNENQRLGIEVEIRIFGLGRPLWVILIGGGDAGIAGGNDAKCAYEYLRNHMYCARGLPMTVFESATT
jgi:hypothetical protein